jgi:hypothetical protein
MKTRKRKRKKKKEKKTVLVATEKQIVELKQTCPLPSMLTPALIPTYVAWRSRDTPPNKTIYSIRNSKQQRTKENNNKQQTKTTNSNQPTTNNKQK